MSEPTRDTPDPFKLFVPEILETLTPKEKVLYTPGMTPEQTRRVETLWETWTDGDEESEELFAAAFMNGVEIGIDMALQQMDLAMHEVEAKQREPEAGR